MSCSDTVKTVLARSILSILVIVFTAATIILWPLTLMLLLVAAIAWTVAWALEHEDII